MHVLNPYRFGSGFDPDYQAVLDYAVTNAISLPNSFIQIGQNQLMIELKGYGLFSKFDVFHNFTDNTTSNEAFKNICWKRLVEGQVLTDGTGANYLEQGIQGSVTTPSIRFDSGFNFSTDGIGYTLDDASYGGIIYQNTSIYQFTAKAVAQNSFLLNNSAQKRINSGNTNLNSSVNLTSATGLIAISRYSSTNVSVFHQATEYVRTQNSSNLWNDTFIINGYINAGSPNITSCGFLGASLSSTDVSNLRTAYNNYLTYLGLAAFA